MTNATTLEPPRFVGNKPRSREIALEHHIVFNGTIYENLVIRRMTTADVLSFVDEARENGEKARLPMFFAADGSAIPAEVLDALDPDDAEAVNKAITDFLPRALRPAA